MNDKSFIDTNLWVYFFSSTEISSDGIKKQKVIDLLKESQEVKVSAQVLSELSNVLIRKMGFGTDVVQKRVYELIESVEVMPLESTDIIYALDLMDRYTLSWFDALIVSSAIRSGASLLFTEDMQNGLVIDNSIKIVNPFI